MCAGISDVTLYTKTLHHLNKSHTPQGGHDPMMMVGSDHQRQRDMVGQARARLPIGDNV